MLVQTDARCPAGQVMGHHLHRQPGGVGGETARGQVVQPDAVLEVSDGILDLGVANLALPENDQEVSAVSSPIIAAVTADTPLEECARLKRHYNLNHLPVVDDGHVIGVIQ